MLSCFGESQSTYRDHHYLEYNDLLDHQVGVPSTVFTTNSKEENVMNQELYGVEKIIGKPASKMDLNDPEKIIESGKIKLAPKHTLEEVLNEKYLRTLFLYFPHIPVSYIAEYLLGKKANSGESNKFRDFIAEKQITHYSSQKKEFLYEHMTYVWWATGEEEAAIKFHEDKQKLYESKTKNMKPDVAEEASPDQDITHTFVCVDPAEEEKPVEKENSAQTEPETEPREPQPHRTRINGYVEIGLYGNKPQILRALADLMEKYGIDVEDVSL